MEADPNSLFAASDGFLLSDADLANLIGGESQAEGDQGFPGLATGNNDFEDMVGWDQSNTGNHP